MNLDAVRSELPVLEHVAYLNTGTFGPIPRRTSETMFELERRELEAGRLGKPYFDELRELRTAAREALGRLLAAPASSLALTRSTSDGCNVAVASLGLCPGDEVVTTDVEHFGLLGPLHASGARVHVVEVRDRPAAAALDAVADAIGPATRLVAISHVAWSTGQILPVAQLAAAAHAAGAVLLVDGAQSVGSIAVDIPATGADFYTVSGQKWLLGPDGTGALYVEPSLLDRVAVPFVSYYGQAGYEPDGTYVPSEGATRFDIGTIPAPALAGLVQSLAFAEEAGPDRFERAHVMAERCRELLDAGFDVVTEPGQATLVSFRVPGETSPIVEALAARGVSVRDLPGTGWIRASAGFWTVEEELERLVDGLAAAV